MSSNHPVLSILAAACLLIAPLASAQTSFTAMAYPAPGPVTGPGVASGNGAFVVGDFNGDGYADLVEIAQSDTAHLFIWMNREGTLAPPVQIPYTVVGNTPYRLAVADWNGDRRLDLAVLSHQGVVSVYPGNGDGSFGAPSNYPVANFSAGGDGGSLVAVDVDGVDGQDFAVLDSAGLLTIFKNAGQGTFTSQIIQADAVSSPAITKNLVVGDFNGDGIPDLAFLEESCDSHPTCANKAYVLWNQNQGYFSGKTLAGNFSEFNLLFAGSLDLSRTQLLITQDPFFNLSGTHYLYAYYYNGATATFEGTQIAADQAGATWGVAVTDIDGDGRPDVVRVASSGTMIYKGQGNRTFQFIGGNDVSSSGPLSAIATGFFRSDNLRDLVTTDLRGDMNFQHSVWLLLNNNAQGNCPYPASAGVNICSAVVTGNELHLTATGRAQTQPVNHMEVWIDGTKIYQIFSDEVDTTQSLSSGAHDLSVVEVEADGTFLKTNQKITVAANSCSTPAAQTVRFCSPSPDSTAGAPVHVSASANVADFGALRLYVDNKTITTVATPAVYMDVPMTGGPHHLVVVAYDRHGGSFVDSRYISIR